MKELPFRQLARHLGVASEDEIQVLGYQIDSRLVQPGELFFALLGEKSDGHLHLQEVKKRGGVGAVVSKGYTGPSFGLLLIPVEDVIEALHELARFSLKESKAQRIGVTGSVGKTTTKEFIASLLEGKFKVYKSVSSYNTKLTFPLMLLNRKGDEEVLVLEMGMSEPGDISRLVQIAAPDIAVLTKIALAHAAFFPGGMVDIARGKAEIFSHPKTRLAIFGHAFLEFSELVASIRAEKMTFSLDARAADYFLSPIEGKYAIDEKGVRVHQFDLPFHQTHILEDFLAAVCTARAMRMEWGEIEGRLKELQLPKMRFEQFERGGISFINDAYNANPESMRAALLHLPFAKEGGKRIGVLGAMKDLGPFSEEAHREVGQMAVKALDHLLALGEETSPYCEAFDAAKKPAEQFFDREELIERLKVLMRSGDVVLVKGSRALEMEKIFAHI